MLGTRRTSLADGRARDGDPDAAAVHARAAPAAAADGAGTGVRAAGVGQRGRRVGQSSAQRRPVAGRRSIRRVRRALPGARRSPAGSLQTPASRGTGRGHAGGRQVRRDHRPHLRPANAHRRPHPLPLPQFQNCQRKFRR